MTPALSAPHPHGRVRLPRLLLLWWSLWLLASWAQAFVWNRPLAQTPETYATSMRTMLLSVSLGLTVVWPMFRLSMREHHHAGRLAFIDWLALIVTLQVVLWPTRLSTNWTAQRVALVDAVLASWSLLLAGIIALGLRSRAPRSRLYAMFFCLVVVGLGPAVAVSRSSPTVDPSKIEWSYWSPVSAPWVISASARQGIILASDWLRTIIVAAAALLVWAGVLLQSRGHRRPATGS